MADIRDPLHNERTGVSEGLRYWSDATFPGGPRLDAIERVIQSPQLSDALRHSIGTSHSLYDRDPVLHRNVNDFGRLALGVLVLYLDATGGVTHRRLREVSGSGGLVSHGRATAILWQLRRIGYIAAESDGAGGLNYRYAPTQEMRRAFSDRVRTELEAFACIEPALAPALARFDEPDFNRAFWGDLGRRTLAAVADPLQAEFPIVPYSQRNAGLRVLFAMLPNLVPGGVFPSPGVVSLSITALAKRCGVSRTHVRRLLAELAAAGYYEPQGDGTGRITALLCEHLRYYFTFIYVGMAASAAVALDTCDAQTAKAAQ